MPQAEALDRLLAEFGGKTDVVLYINVPEEVLLERLSGRWICRGAQQHVYHMLFNPPKTPGVCDVDGTELFQRADDTREVQQNRIQVFLKQTAPLIDYYRSRGDLVEIDGQQDIAGVQRDLNSAIEAARARSEA